MQQGSWAAVAGGCFHSVVVVAGVDDDNFDSCQGFILVGSRRRGDKKDLLRI